MPKELGIYSIFFAWRPLRLGVRKCLEGRYGFIPDSPLRSLRLCVSQLNGEDIQGGD
jgi:hypothetical protein